MFDCLNLKIGAAIECVKKIHENNSCMLCDKRNTHHKRHPCGHSACEDCVAVSQSCFICLTPPGANEKTVIDPVLTKRVKNATELFNVFQETFNVNVYKKQRLSDQLKVEKELFPECIQAPIKYSNKRKSHNRISSDDKENSYFSEALLTPVKKSKMENSVSYVQQWLHKNENNSTRKPLSNVNSNDPRLLSTKNQFGAKINPTQYPISGKVSANCRRNQKRTTKTTFTNVENQASFKKISKHRETKKIGKKLKNESMSDLKRYFNNDNDESGIVIDDEPMVISENLVEPDKDALALMAVLEADKHQYDLDVDREDICKISLPENEKHKQKYHVPFYKKSYLTETCKYCNNEALIDNVNVKNDSSEINENNNVSLTIENKTFKTIINIKKTENISVKQKTSALVQTDISEIILQNKKYIQSLHTSEVITGMPKDDCKKLDGKEMDGNKSDKFVSEKRDKSIPLVIEESDTDSDLGVEVFEVTAEIHNSNDIFDSALSSIENVEDHNKRRRRAPRGFTPDSSDSSEKENFNPNRQKKIKLDGKKDSKKS